MGIIEREEIVGYFLGPQGQEVVCVDCATDEETTDIKQDEILFQDNIESSEKMYFCDRCKKQIA